MKNVLTNYKAHAHKFDKVLIEDMVSKKNIHLVFYYNKPKDAGYVDFEGDNLYEIAREMNKWLSSEAVYD